MPNLIPVIEPMGIRPQFKRVKAYMKAYTRGFDDPEYERKLAAAHSCSESPPPQL
jgi:hypothetical protein